MTLPVSDPAAWATAMNNLGMAPLGIAGQPILPDFDPALGMMTGIPPITPMMPGLGIVPPPIPPDMPVAKEIIHCKSCTLFPPNPNLPPPATRERPPGCKTVFVGGLPENGTEQIIVEVFEQCGEIIAIRKSKKNFCHIRFAEEYMVDKALYLSGYRIRLGSSTDKKDTGRLHVDFAQARDDLYEWECKQRMLAREERHRRRMEEERMRPPSPPPVVHYSDHECSIVAEKLKDDSKFSEAVQTLLTWIERGEVNRRSANHFYSMIQSANSHVRRLVNEKATHEKEMEEAKEKFKQALSGILIQFEQIVAVYHSASKQKAWDHFTKAQRKNISVWCKQAEEIRNIHNDELMGIRREEEMEMSDDEIEETTETKETEESALVSQAEALKEENDSLRWQLDAYRNEVELLKQEQGKAHREDDPNKEQQLKLLQQALQGMQQHLLKVQEEYKKKEAELDRIKDDNLQVEQLLENFHEKQENCGSRLCASSQEGEQPLEKTAVSNPVKSEREALLVGIISTFLHVHPFGASIEYICSYLNRLDNKASYQIPSKLTTSPLLPISTSDVESLMSRLQHTFRQEMTGVGASLEKRWKFCGFEGLKLT
ncbi:ecto-NOX disulfide-thiol exchanger 2 isoform X16 [Mus musculus]|uniref:Ecto-NOX disulfide-thiol exchanger 2 n=3 Tax=Mus musculus TaxID=10090 RepID=ENOX2_MOUSE|nr:ecto-NOX disulfide-thiol exchanger 2 isoform a [Mus musculus]NP_001258377.1 ecto-NOX disulfide-thiol exchanger 2 isoform a [Mus musculus]NP_001258378.1 ecto-NOX disulfide-thiol exchanger 2 isoform a [Mus musculus]NP_666063.1 ecto-NOX disulfide-thiol exchanger 2 isoform a [Mus musculus]XP_011249302.2 ecto-NOX disulfide-thiol exchanger 2 isoform X16 [Mus musculus]XP_036017783.1 ecto-NOX disulfide-thiol exchanger 2 isoform X16 [Mus musculus]XP_036017784.1 ecto-NOX disulfide-thiol exchanger 2 |eukprot:NP_001258376.1 ecto-NOX disulfide-thiol exchanger 2 isoform a [Mus musculus]